MKENTTTACGILDYEQLNELYSNYNNVRLS
jgi:hypothetical protein